MTTHNRSATLAGNGRRVCFPGWLEVPGLLHGTTTRAAAPEPRKRDLFAVLALLRVEGVVPRRFTLGGDQVHGETIAVVDQPLEFGHHPPGFRWGELEQIGEFAETDALITNIPGAMLAIQTADCMPVFLVDPPTRMIGLAHCGWRGLAAGLAGKTARRMEEMGAKASRMEAWLGPAIRAANYEVGTELVDRFRGLCGGAKVSPDGCRLDLAAVARHQLETAGMVSEKIYDSGECTAGQPDRYHSHRRDGENSGRLVSFLAFDPVES
jgi:YfiH family protein